MTVCGRSLSCKRMIPSDSIPGRFDSIACSTPQTPRIERNLSAILYLPPFPMLEEHTTLTSRAIQKQLCEPVRFHYACVLPYICQYRYITTMLPDFARNDCHSYLCNHRSLHVGFVMTKRGLGGVFSNFLHVSPTAYFISSSLDNHYIHFVPFNFISSPIVPWAARQVT